MAWIRFEEGGRTRSGKVDEELADGVRARVYTLDSPPRLGKRARKIKAADIVGIKRAGGGDYEPFKAKRSTRKNPSTSKARKPKPPAKGRQRIGTLHNPSRSAVAFPDIKRGKVAVVLSGPGGRVQTVQDARGIRDARSLAQATLQGKPSGSRATIVRVEEVFQVS